MTGVAPFGGPLPTLADAELAVRTAIPLVKQHLYDTLWAVAGGAAYAERHDQSSDVQPPLSLHPSRATPIAQGYGGLARFFAGARAELAAVDDAVVELVLGPAGGIAWIGSANQAIRNQVEPALRVALDEQGL